MKVSIITTTFNSESTLVKTFDSVLMQEYKDYEMIIIDGCSTDNTLQIIGEYKEIFGKKLVIISEPDAGIYDAMNKGIRIASGNVIGFLNSDDFYAKNNVLGNIVKEIREVDAVYANINYVHEKDPSKIVRRWKTGAYQEKSGFRKGWHPAHPTFYVREEIYREYGNFNLIFELAADFEIMLRFLERYKIKARYVDEIWVHMRLGGATNKNLRNIIKQNLECYRAFNHNDLKTSILYPFFRILPKIKQFYDKE